nr:LCP family protein [Nakamurella aerolata]
MGSDTRSGANGNAGNTGSGTSDSAQSDTLMIAHISGDRQRVTIVSIPRDLRVQRVDCRLWDAGTGKLSDEWERVSKGATGKITNAYSVGGPTCTTAFVQKLTGLNIDRVISIDFEGFKTMVNALDGINVNICKPINDRELQWIVKESGPNIPISGEQALSLVRARKVIGDPSGDIGRIRRQQVVLSTMLRKATSAGTLTDPGKLNNFLTAFAKSTNTANVNIDTLVQLRKQLGDLTPGKITFYTLPTRPDPNNPEEYRIADKTASAVWEALRNDTPLPGQTGGPAAPSSTAPAGSAGGTGSTAATSSAPASSSASASRSSAASTTTSSAAPQTVVGDLASINLKVYNVAGTGGIAGEVRDQLASSGFDVPDSALVRDDNATQSSVQVLYGPGHRAQAAAVAAAVPQATLKQRQDLGDEVRLLVGSGWDGTIERVRPGQTLPSRLQTTAPRSAAATSATSAAESSTSGTGSTGAAKATTSSKPSSTVTIKSSDIASVNAAETTDCA